MGRKRSQARNLYEFLLARGALKVTEFLPLASFPLVARSLGGLLFAVIRSRRRVVRENLRLAYGSGGQPQDAHALGRSALAILCRSFMELGRLPKDPERMRALVSFEDPAAWRELQTLLGEGPVIFTACHFGAFEIPGVVAPLVGVPISTLVRPLDNPLLERWLNAIRERFGQVIVSNRGGFRDLQKALKGGSSVGVLVDLNHRPRRRLFVDFFGVPAATAPTAALLALRTGRPLVAIFARRTHKPLHYQLQLGQPHWPRLAAERKQELQRLMQAATQDVERCVRAEPGLWLWTHRRWKTRPPRERPQETGVGK